MTSRFNKIIKLDSSDDDCVYEYVPPSRGTLPRGRVAKQIATKAKKWVEDDSSEESEESEEEELPRRKTQVVKPERDYAKNLLPTKKRKMRELTEIRKGKIRRFNDLNSADGQRYKYGPLGTTPWISELIKFLKEPRNRVVCPTDVCHWLKTFTEFFQKERKRTALESKPTPPNSCDSQESVTSTGSDSGIGNGTGAGSSHTELGSDNRPATVSDTNEPGGDDDFSLLDHEMNMDESFRDGQDRYEDITSPKSPGTLPPVTLEYQDENFGEPESDESMEVASLVPVAKPGCSTDFTYNQERYSPEPEYLFVRPKVPERPADPNVTGDVPRDGNIIPPGPAATSKKANLIPNRGSSYTATTDLEDIPVDSRDLLMNINCFGDMNAVLAYLTDTDQINPDLETLQTLTSVVIKLTDKAKVQGSCEGVNLNACCLALQSARASLEKFP